MARRQARIRTNILLGGYDSLIAGGRNEDDLLELTGRDLINLIIARLSNNDRTLIQDHVDDLTTLQRNQPGRRPLDDWYRNRRAYIRAHVVRRGGGNQGNGGNNNPAPAANGNQGNGGNNNPAPAANVNQGNGGNGAANVLPRFILLGALLAFFCAALVVLTR
uniref:Uncharacterized protein n=1 Tax=Skeletonema marinoi TaxID=267567 RepID=A0A7S2LKT9_9STRA|mmetsp:Transcript_26472/g.45039  ORF Transcript_26472/g.45039 Transcript_26472/m.45039 type:complete len:163 (+) Transcript_26472:322-810(+)